MGLIQDGVTALVQTHGEWVLFLLAVAETCFITGLAIPSGVATSVATLLALQGHLSLPLVVASATAGAWVGDSVGFWVGRLAGERLAAGKGRFAVTFRRRRADADHIFGRHPVVSVTFARLVSFVRTVMPMAAGMSELVYLRFLAYEAVGLAGWVLIYTTLGYFAGESWEIVSRVMGAGGAVVFAVVIALSWWVSRRRAGRRSEAHEPC